MRRNIVGVLVLLAFVLGSPSVVAAQDATPTAAASPFAGLGLPTLDITATADGLEGFPEQLEAGRYHVRLTVSEDVEGGAGFETIQPAGMTAEEFLAWAAASEGGGATPDAAMAASTPVAAAPDPFLTAKWAGGTFAGPGQTAEVVFDLTPGEWIAAPQTGEPVVFEATGEMPADLPEPESQATLTMGEYIIEVTEGELATGSYVVRVDNIGAQTHYIAWVQGPDGFTAEQVETVLAEDVEAEMTGTPAAYSDLDPNVDFTDVAATGNQSMGTSQWVYVQDVQAGTHLLICFFPDAGDGRPHAYHGMYTIVEIE
jgi:hypothetical protein